MPAPVKTTMRFDVRSRERTSSTVLYWGSLVLRRRLPHGSNPIPVSVPVVLRCHRLGGITYILVNVTFKRGRSVMSSISAFGGCVCREKTRTGSEERGNGRRGITHQQHSKSKQELPDRYCATYHILLEPRNHSCAAGRLSKWRRVANTLMGDTSPFSFKSCTIRSTSSSGNSFNAGFSSSSISTVNISSGADALAHLLRVAASSRRSSPLPPLHCRSLVDHSHRYPRHKKNR